MTIAAAIAVISAPVGGAETPAERCKRETAAYNNAWKQAWVLAHPGSTIDNAPAPNPPYVCGQNNDTTPTISTPSTTDESSTAEISTATTSNDTLGPTLTAPTSTSSPAGNVNPSQPAIGAPTDSQSVFSKTLCVQAVRKFAKALGAVSFSCGQQLANIVQNGGRQRSYLLKVTSGAAVDVTGMSDNRRYSLAKNLASDEIPPGGTCGPPYSSVKNVSSQSNGKLQIFYCYGQLDDDGVVEYENGARIEYRMALGQVREQRMQFSWIMNKLNMVASLTIRWRFRMDVKDDDDINVDVGAAQGADRKEGSWRLYTANRGVYFIEHTDILISDPFLRSPIHNTEATQGPRFRCDGFNPCSFPGGEESTTHY
ncbi:hypothetical protein [Gordonia oryzae]|nr:hypothetical protein [Gordonia oryzae]